MQENASTFRDFAENIPALCWTANPDGYIVWYNRRWYEYTGTTPAEMEGWGWQSVHDPNELPRVLEQWRASIATGQSFDMVFPLRAADGGYRPFLTRIYPAKDAAGAVTGWFGLNTDISEQINAEQALRESESRARILADELDHRIKNIFSVIGGLIQLSSQNFPEAKRFATELSQRVLALGRAHDFVRPQSISARAETDSKLFALLRELLAPYQDGKRILLNGEDIRIHDRAATPLALLFHELATNAAKYGALSVSEGRVTISSTVYDRTVQIKWLESGGPPVTTPSRSGFGSSLARMAVEMQLGGTLLYDWTKGGVVVTANVPFKGVVGNLPNAD